MWICFYQFLSSLIYLSEKKKVILRQYIISTGNRIIARLGISINISAGQMRNCRGNKEEKKITTATV